MGFFDFFTDDNDDINNDILDTSTSDINPGSGLPMLNDVIDIEGNVYGTNSSDDFLDDTFSSTFDDDTFDSSFDDDMFNSFDDSF